MQRWHGTGPGLSPLSKARKAIQPGKGSSRNELGGSRTNAITPGRKTKEASSSSPQQEGIPSPTEAPAEEGKPSQRKPALFYSWLGAAFQARCRLQGTLRVLIRDHTAGLGHPSPPTNSPFRGQFLPQAGHPLG